MELYLCANNMFGSYFFRIRNDAANTTDKFIL